MEKREGVTFKCKSSVVISGLVGMVADTLKGTVPRADGVVSVIKQQD